MTPTELSTTLKTWRKAKNLTQREAAAALNVKFSTYKNWDQGRHLPSGIEFHNLLTTIQK